MKSGECIHDCDEDYHILNRCKTVLCVHVKSLILNCRNFFAFNNNIIWYRNTTNVPRGSTSTMLRGLSAECARLAGYNVIILSMNFVQWRNLISTIKAGHRGKSEIFHSYALFPIFVQLIRFFLFSEYILKPNLINDLQLIVDDINFLLYFTLQI